MKISKVMACALAGACMTVGGAFADEMSDGSFELPREVVSAATAFQGYMRNAAAIDSGFASNDQVARGLKAAVSYEPAQLDEGMIAYGAIAALQDDGFVAGVEQAAGRGDERDAFAERLIEDPYAATRIDGAEGAARRIEAALSSQAAPLEAAATQVKAAAYSVQHQAWSKVMVSNAEDRLAEVKSLSAVRTDPSETDNQSMMQAMTAQAPQAAADEAPAGFTAIEARALALAAESILGRAHGADRDRLAPLLSEANSAECLRMSKLTLYECMAVAGPQYEDIFCMGQHAMYDTASCVTGATHSSSQTRMASLSPREEGAGGYAPMVAHHSLRIDPN